MYISGDIGEAVFVLTWKADVHSFNDVSIDYFESKMASYNDERRNFNNDKAIKRLREWLKNIKNRDEQYDHDKMRELFDDARSCVSKEEWVSIVNLNSGWISELDCDYWEWIYDISDEIPMKVYGYLVGLQIASEQLRRKEYEKDTEKS